MKQFFPAYSEYETPQHTPGLFGMIKRNGDGKGLQRSFRMIV
jgi:hypothetical protein